MDEVTFCSPQDYFVVNTLSAVLKDFRQSTEPLSRLTLSARCLQVLYEGFRQIQSSSCVKLSHMDLEQNVFQSLSHLLNIVQNAKELKIFENGETLQGHVNCTDFGSISSLEVKCLPLYQLYGLSKVAANLTNVTCIGCLTRIQELFEQCGADTFRASDVLWSKLNEVHLSYNNLQSLDNSLRLVSNLTHLDLSHNSLTSTDNFLMVLDKLKTLNLSYNSLRTFPEISNAANRHLTSLNLRNNLLTSTEGLERLFCLVSLDLSNNLLPASRTLTYLKPLLLLQCLVLNGNPVSFHPSYRKIVVGSLHPAVISQITFDGHYLTRKEKQQFDQVNASNVSIFTRSEFNDSIDSALSILDSMSDSQRRSGRRRRPRIVEIPTHDDSLPDERFETSVDFCDSPLPFSAHSSSGHDRDATGSERCDSGLRLPRLQTSSRSSSSRRSISRLKQSLSATVLAGTPTSTSDGVRNNVEITGNRICFVENKDTDGSTPLAGGNTGNGVFLLNAIEKVQREGAGRCDSELGNEVPGVSLKPADDVRGITRGTSSTDESGFVSTHDSSLTTTDVSVVVQDVAVVVESELSADNADYNELSANNADNYNQPANNAVPSIEDLSDGVAQSSLHGSPQDVAQDSNLVSTAGVNANSTNSNSFDHDTYSSRPPAADVTRLRRAAPLHISRSFSCAAPQANTARSYDKFRSDSFERNGGGNRNSPFDAKSFEQDLTAEDLEVGSPATEEVTLDDLLENGFEGDFLIYVVEGPPNTTSDGKCIVSVIDNWLYVRSAKEVIERLDLRNLQAVQKVTDHLTDFAAKRGGKIVVDPDFPGPVVRLLFDTFKKDNRERFFSVRSQDQGKQLARLLKSFIKTKNSKKMQCLRCDSHFDESEGTVVHKDITEVNVKPASSFQASRNSVLHCPKCDSHFVIEVSDKTGMDSARDSLTQSMSVKSQTMSKLDREHSFSRNKDHGKHKKRRRQKQSSLALLSSSVSSSTGTPGSLPGSQLFSTRRSTIAEPSLEGSDLSRTFDDDEAYEALPDDATAINAVKFYFEDQNN